MGCFGKDEIELKPSDHPQAAFCKLYVNGKKNAPVKKRFLKFCLEIPQGLTMQFRKMQSTHLCNLISKLFHSLNKLAWSKCCGIDLLHPWNEVVNGLGISIAWSKPSGISTIRANFNS